MSKTISLLIFSIMVFILGYSLGFKTSWDTAKEFYGSGCQYVAPKVKWVDAYEGM